MKKKFFHTPTTQKGKGDYVGTGIRNPKGIIRKGFTKSKNKTLSIPPKSLA